MKYLLLVVFVLFAIFNLKAQNFLNFPDGTRFFDVPRSTFLTVKQNGLTTHITEHEEHGGSIWTDSVDFPVWQNQDTIIFINDVKRFGNTNEYLVSIYQRLLPDNLPFTASSSANLSIRISLEDQSIVDTSSTFTQGATLYLAEKNDSTITLFSHRTISQVGTGYETYDISNNLNTSFIAPYDSVYHLGYFGATIFQYAENQLDYYWYGPGTVGLSNYNDDLSFTGYESYSTDGPLNYSSIPIVLYGDSIFLFSQSENNDYRRHWLLAWLDKDLTQIDAAGIYPANYNAPSANPNWFYHYHVNNDRVQITDQNIYILASLNNTSNDSLTIFVYDHYFNEVCTLPLGIRFSSDKSIVKINGHIYYQTSGEDGTYNYHLINGCEFTYLSVDENMASNLTIYPNPSQSIFNIQNPKNERLQIRALNLQGKEIMSLKSTNTNVQLDLETFPSGIYFLEITSNKEKTTQKVIKI